ncbi:MAG: alpha/beta hydrolase [Microbacteriaceae bacterium]
MFREGPGSRTPKRTTGRGAMAGVMVGGIPFLRTGNGPPLVFIRTLTPSWQNPRGLRAWAERRMLKSAARTHSVYALGRSGELPDQLSMADFAAQYAGAIQDHFGMAVPVIGWSTSGAIALQLAADHPEVVERLVVIAGAARLSETGRRMQSRYTRRLIRGDRAAASEMVPQVYRSKLSRWVVSVMLASTPAAPDSHGLVVMLDAEDRFDLTPRLAEVTAQTLVIGGGRDVFYPPELTQITADGVRDGRRILYPYRKHHQIAVGARFRADLAGFLTAGR